MSEYFKAFDELRKKGWFIGELIWNFADFRTDQGETQLRISNVAFYYWFFRY